MVRGVAAAMARAAFQTWLGIGRYATQFAGPALLASIVLPGRHGRPSWGRRTACLSLLLGPPLTTWLRNRPAVSAPRFVLGRIADDACYGAGVWTSALDERTLTPLRPRIAARPLPIDPSPTTVPTPATA